MNYGGIPIINRPNVLHKAVTTWGVLAQTDMAIEEMSELTKAIIKYRRANSATKAGLAEADIREEIADVFIMLAQLIIIFDGDGGIQSQIDRKITRLAGRLRMGEEGAAQAVMAPAT